MKYFAYGSNMNPERMLARDVNFKHAIPARLPDWELTFNKISSLGDGEGYANIKPQSGESCLGVLYDIDRFGLHRLDMYEGYPHHYFRREIGVFVGKRKIKAWVYLAQSAFCEEGLKPSPQYLCHLISGAARYLPRDYFEYLRRIECV
jgi:gamma-glutamylcyclotransferase